MSAADMNSNIIVILLPLWIRTNSDSHLLHLFKLELRIISETSLRVKCVRWTADWGLDTLLLILQQVGLVEFYGALHKASYIPAMKIEKMFCINGTFGIRRSVND